MAEIKGAYIDKTPVYFKDEAARGMISDVYDSTKTYSAGNLCIHNGKLYRAKRGEITGTWNSSLWVETNFD